MKVVSPQLGHASTVFTLDVYSHVLPHMQAEAADRVTALLGRNGNPRQGTRTAALIQPESAHPSAGADATTIHPPQTG